MCVCVCVCVCVAGRESLGYTFAFESEELRAAWSRCIHCKTVQSAAVLTVPTISHPRVSTPLATVIHLQNEEQDGFRATPPACPHTRAWDPASHPPAARLGPILTAETIDLREAPAPPRVSITLSLGPSTRVLHVFRIVFAKRTSLLVADRDHPPDPADLSF